MTFKKQDTYRMGGEEYDLVTEFMDHKILGFNNFFELMEQIDPREKDNITITLEKRSGNLMNKKANLQIKHIIIKSAFPMSFYSTDIAQKTHVFCIASIVGKVNKNFIIPFINDETNNEYRVKDDLLVYIINASNNIVGKITLPKYNWIKVIEIPNPKKIPITLLQEIGELVEVSIGDNYVKDGTKMYISRDNLVSNCFYCGLPSYSHLHW